MKDGFFCSWQMPFRPKNQQHLKPDFLANGFVGWHSNPGFYPGLLMCSPFRAKKTGSIHLESSGNIFHSRLPNKGTNLKFGTWNLELYLSSHILNS